jgi:hypothetical protein
MSEALRNFTAVTSELQREGFTLNVKSEDGL